MTVIWTMNVPQTKYVIRSLGNVFVQMVPVKKGTVVWVGGAFYYASLNYVRVWGFPGRMAKASRVKTTRPSPLGFEFHER